MALTPVGALSAPVSAFAQTPGGGALPTLRDTIIDAGAAKRAKQDAKGADGVVQTAIVGFAGGYTTNAGPTPDPAASPVFETSFFFLHERPLGEGGLNLQADATASDFTDFSDARGAEFGLKAAFAPNDESWLVALGAEKRRDIEEDVSETSLSASRQWSTGGVVTPYVESGLVYLDYADVNVLFLEFANQDDRDRLSGSLEGGIRLKSSDALSLAASVGVNAKKYSEAIDDFGLDRNNLSTFLSFGATYDTGGISATVSYAPVYRVYAESAFSPLIAHTFNASGSAALTDAVRVFGGARMGLEETDFLAARTVEEQAANIGITLAWPGKASMTLEAAYTNRAFDGVDRVDRKYELQWRAEQPLSDRLTLTARAGYLLFNSSFGDLSLDQRTAMVGLVYRIQ